MILLHTPMGTRLTPIQLKTKLCPALYCETIHSLTSASCFAVSSSTIDWWRVCKVRVG